MVSLVDLLDGAGALWWQHLLPAVWQASLLAALAVTVATLGKRWPSPLRYGLLFLCLIKFALPPELSPPGGLFGWTVPELHRALDLRAMEFSRAPAAGGGDAERGLPAAPEPPRSAADAPGEPRAMPAPPGTAEPRSLPAATVRATLPGWRGCLLVAYLAGSLACATAIALQWLRLLPIRRQARAVVSGPLREAYLSAARQLGLRRVPALLRSTAPLAPMACGLLHPQVILPSFLMDRLSLAETRAIIAHELAHHRRWDLWAIGFEAALSVLWWFNPLFWTLRRACRQVREECCDDLVLKSGIAAGTSYCDSLLAAARSLLARRSVLRLASLGAGLHPLGNRLTRILDASLGRPAGLSRAQAFLLVALAALLLPGRRSGGEAEGPAPSTAPPPTADAAGPASVELQVVHRGTGEPLAGISVRSWSSDQPPVERGMTGADGRMRIPLSSLRVDTVAVLARKEGFVPTLWVQQREPGQALPEKRRLLLEPGTTVGGKVTGEAGEPLEGVVVHLNVSGPETGERPDFFDHPVRTGSDGRWDCGVFPARAGSVFLRLVHPDFKSEAVRLDSEPAIRALREGKDLRLLHRGMAVEGVVLDPEGLPLEGARVTQGVPMRLPTGLLTGLLAVTSTGKDGRFRFRNGQEGPLPLTVEAEGFAPEVREVNVRADMPPIEFRLGRGRDLRARVVGPGGRPVAGALVKVTMAHGSRSLDREFETDAGGTTLWRHAPPGVIFVDVSGQGYQRLHSHPLPPDGGEATITLRPLLRVRGRVLEDGSRKPVTRFRVARGVAAEAEGPIHWDEKDAQTFQGGLFEAIFLAPGPRNQLRFEAEGRLPAVSRLLSPGEGDVDLEVALAQGRGLEGLLLSPDGRPLPEVEVLLPRPSAPVVVANGGRAELAGTPAARTDREGRFSVPPQAEAFHVVVVDDLGFADVTGEDLNSFREVKLRPWGRLEGQVKLEGRPRAGETVRLEPGVPPERASRIVSFRFSAATDGEGRFLFERVPPGRWRASREVWPTLKTPFSDPEPSHDTLVEVEPGPQSGLVVGGGGRSLTGRLARSADSEAECDWSRSLVRLVPKGPREELPPRYAAPVGSDGTFHLEGVDGGSYLLTTVALSGPLPGPAPGDRLGRFSRELEVTETARGTSPPPLDLGTLPLRVVRPLLPGDRAPPISIETLEGKRFDLESQRGKLVFVHFWASWCWPCRFDAPQMLKIREAFPDEGRLVMVGLSLDDSLDAAKKYKKEAGWTWPQAFAGPWSTSSVAQEYRVSSIPHSFLVGPDGRILARGLPGASLSVIAAEMGKR